LSCQHFALYLAGGEILLGWACSLSGSLTEGIWWIEHGIQSWQATGATLVLPLWLAVKAEALHLLNRTFQALEAIREAGALAERFEEGLWSAELLRLRGVFLTAIGAEETQIEASLCEATKPQRSRSRFRYRSARKQPMKNIGGKKRAHREGVDSDYLFDKSSDSVLRIQSENKRLSHLSLRLILWLSGHTPLNFVKFPATAPS
jgi:hypothetical protein